MPGRNGVLGSSGRVWERGLAAAFHVFLAAAGASAQGLPAVPVPAENPVTEEKRILGKILFWDEQLSSDDSVACGTCHVTEAAGADPRLGVHPGADGTFSTADDVFGSPGVVRRGSDLVTIDDPVFGFDVQVTGRSAPSFFTGLWAPETFWDGRAGSQFLDPEDGTTVRIASGGALENQAVGPILSSVEMAKDGRTWSEVTDKLERVTPLVHATDLPADVIAALAVSPTYPDLFEDAFGDSAITAWRIGFAIATYERTLVSDETPWDLFIDGDTSALTANQQQGWTFFQGSACATCHASPFFTDDTFRNIGVRDPDEDLGRAEVTGLAADDGRFKVPSLRNGGVKEAFLHTGELTTLADVVTFYGPGNQGSSENLDPLMPVPVPGPQVGPLLDFLSNGLTDPRVAAATFPFDRPTITAAGALPVPEPGVGVSFGAGALLLARLARRRAH